MRPVIALVGRPNVGKSTLFNALTRRRDAIVADYPGLTRDRQYGVGRVGSGDYLVVDTGGLSSESRGVEGEMAQQAMVAIGDSDHLIFLVDGHEGLCAADEAIAEVLRVCDCPVTLVVNKSDRGDPDVLKNEFYALGLGEPQPIAATHNRGIQPLIDSILEQFDTQQIADEQESKRIRVAIIGRPNVGKSTLVNRLLGEDRVVVFDMPGTTRDAISIPFERDGVDYTLIDTAGVRRRARVRESVEKFSIIKTLQAITDAHVVILVGDAQQGISDQDAHLVGMVIEAGRALILAVNKWDGLTREQRNMSRRELEIKLPFLDFAPIHTISALHGSGVGELFGSIQSTYRSAMSDLSTSHLTTLLEEAIKVHQPPLVHGRRIKLRYAHQGGRNPPTIVIHGNQTESTPDSYRRYLQNHFRTRLKLTGTPVRIEFRSGTNPYASRKNRLTHRQIKRKRRLMGYVKGGR